MGVRHTAQEGKTALYDSTTGLAFGPVFESQEEAERFEKFAARETDDRDLRTMPLDELAGLYHRFTVEDWAEDA